MPRLLGWSITFQVIDPAILPKKRIRPKRTLNVLLAGVVSLEYLDR